jgi:integrase
MPSVPARTELGPYHGRIDLAKYDRSAQLTPDERRLTGAWVKRGAPILGRRQLPRLYAPLADVLLHDGRDLVGRSASVRILLREVGQSGQAYWGWTDEHWLDLVRRESLKASSLLAVAYLLCGFKRFYEVECSVRLARAGQLVFGHDVFDRECERMLAALKRVGFRSGTLRALLPGAIAAAALEGGDPRLESFDKDLLVRLHGLYHRKKNKLATLSNGLAALGLTKEAFRFRVYGSPNGDTASDIDPEWADWCRRWLATSTLRPKSRAAVYNGLLRTGRWLAKAHPEVTAPEHWTADLCADYLAAVDRLAVGEWSGCASDRRHLVAPGKPICPQTKVAHLQFVRRFLSDVQAWEWKTLRCDPRRHLATPRSVRRLVGVNPRTIDDAVWLKLIWASLNLQAADFRDGDRRFTFEMIKAIAIVWTHAGLRSNEILRLQLGCAQLQSDDLVDDAGTVTAPAGKLCYLAVPTGKTSTAYTKPVDAAVYVHIEAWRSMRPEQRPILDPVTGDMVSYLFQVRNRRLGRVFINGVVIPLLCAKAGVQLADSTGRITSHRGRASAVTALASVPQGMNVFELAQWCGHRYPTSTMHYVRVRPTQLAGSFAKADQMSRMVRVLVDHEAVVSGAAGRGEPYRYYDLGDILCTNAFWSTCQHRFACAGCYFGLPKASARAAALTSRSSVAEMLQSVPLSPDERAAAEGDAGVLDRFLAKLEDRPALDGRTPREIVCSHSPGRNSGCGCDGAGAL